MAVSRSNSERVRQIEAELERLALELHQLVQPTEEEREVIQAAVQDGLYEWNWVWNDQAGGWGQKLNVAVDVLDQRKEAEEEQKRAEAGPQA